MSDSINKMDLPALDYLEFASAILGVAPTSPEVDVQAICKAWQAATKADAVWLMIKNHYTDIEPWEIFAQLPNEEPPSQLTFTTNNIAEYAVQSRQCVLATNSKEWTEIFLNIQYKIPWRSDLDKMGAESLLCIPLLKPITPQDQNPDVCPLAEGAIVLFHKSQQAVSNLKEREESLIVMGQLTGFVLLNSYQAQQRRILVELNNMAERYLTRVTKNLARLRREYLNDVIDLIKKSIHVKGVSIFYRNISEAMVECLATTGICNAQGKKLEEDELSEASYPAMAHRTGRCFATGKPIVLTETREMPEKTETPRYFECPDHVPIRAKPAIFYPILSQGSATRAAGVIRCALHTSTSIKGGSRRFDHMDVQTLGFIARQLAPALHSMDINIRREEAISVTKHDLRQPLQMVQGYWPQIESVIEKNQHNNLVLKDMKTGVEVAINLVEQLEPDPEEVKDFDPQLTHLEGDIVARLKAMLSHVAYQMRKMTIKFGSFNDVPPVSVDRSLIERALSNLVMNAIKYGQRETEISILPSRAQDGFNLNVINYGVGVAPEDIPHIFKTHFRGSRTMSSAMGSGLGLTIAKAAMVRHGGDLLLTKAENPTVFSMFFPRKLIVDK